MSAADRSPRLLQIFPSRSRGGCEEYALTVGRAARDRGWQVTAAFPECPATASLLTDYKRVGAHCRPTAFAFPPRRWPHDKRVVASHCAQTLRLLTLTRPDAVHLSLPWPICGLGPLLACAACRVPTLVAFQFVMEIERLAPRTRSLYGWARSRRQRWVAVSRQNAALLRDAFSAEEREIQVIYNGADLAAAAPFFDPQARAAARLNVREELQLAPGAPVVLGVGRLTGQKGFDLLLPAVASVGSQFPDLGVAIAGEGENRQELERQARRLGIERQVRLLGRRSDVPRLMAAADVFAFPSRGEGHPFALVEAMAAGLPVAATNVSGISELIEHERNGLLTPPEDSAALAAALRRLLGSPAERATLGERAAATARRFSSDRMLDETFSTLAELTAWPPAVAPSPVSSSPAPAAAPSALR